MNFSSTLNDMSVPLDHMDLVVRLLAALVGGAVLGLDRELNNRTAGLRTHMLTSLAAAIYTVITLQIFASASSTDGANADPIRIVEAVTAGVAFLAAGAIIRSGAQDVKGLTTGAGLWLAGAVGTACGAGFVLIAIAGTLLGAAVIVVLREIEKRIMNTKGGSDVS